MKLFGCEASPVTVTEYGHLISFLLENCEGQRIFVQYRLDQVWRDEDGVWQVKEGHQPFYTSCSAAVRQPTVKLSPAISLTLRARSAIGK
jgi:hypothetical protein